MKLENNSEIHKISNSIKKKSSMDTQMKRTNFTQIYTKYAQESAKTLQNVGKRREEKPSKTWTKLG